MHVSALFVLVGMLQGSPATSQAVDSTPAPDSSRTVGPRVVLQRPLLLQLPIDDPREALTLVPGIVRRGTAFGIGAGGGLRLRGGGLDAAGVYVDGAPVRNLMTGTQGLTLATDAIDAIAVTRGPGGVEVGDAAGGGVLEYVTRTGGSQLDGHLVAASDAPFGDAASAGFNRFSASAGGPAGQRVSWFLSGEVTGQRSAYRGRGAAQQPAFVWGGADTVVNGVTVPTFLETTGLKRPLDWATERRGQGKVSLRVGRGTLAVTGLISEIQQRFFPGADVGDTALFSGARTNSRVAVANWAGALGPGALAPVLHAVVSLGHDGASTGLLAAASQTSSPDPALGVEWSSLVFAGSESIPGTTDQIVRNVRSNAGLRIPFLGQTSLRNVQPYRLNPYGLATGWPTQGSDGPLATASENRLDARAWIDWVFAARHQLRAGLDYSRASDAFYRADLISETDLDAWTAQPKRFGLFASDRITRGKLAVAVGARFDHFTPGGALPVVPGRIYTNPAWNFASGTDDTAYAASIARVMRRTTGKSAISPRLQAVYDVSSSTSLRLGFGQVVEPPSLSQIFGNSNSDLATTSVFAPFGRDVRYIKSTTGDVGVGARVTPRLHIDLDGYVSRLASYAPFIEPFDDPANPGRTLDVNVLTPIDTITAHGVEASVAWRPVTDAIGRLVYSWDRRAGVSTQAFDAIAGYITGPERGDFSATATLRAQSGVAYIPVTNVGSGTVVSEMTAVFIGPLATARLPWTKTVDVRVSKRMRLSHVTGSLYADLRDALNFRNAVGAFTETRGVTNPLFQANVLSPEFTGLHIEAQANGTLLTGNAVDLRPDCSTWTGTTGGPVDCAALRQVERRFGNGDGIYDLNEQTTALDAYFNAFFGSAQFYAPGRTARVGIELTF
jgi:outer membrane receptor protein involved in Fe transport